MRSKLPFLLTLFYILIFVHAVKAQMRYESYNFYGNKQTEYIEIKFVAPDMSPEFVYYTSANSKRITLNYQGLKEEEEQKEYYVSFPNDRNVYKLKFEDS